MFQLKAGKTKYNVLNEQCIGCKCLHLGQYQSRGATLSGSRNTGNFSNECLQRAYHGCPDEEDRGYSEELAKDRKKSGMKVF